MPRRPESVCLLYVVVAGLAVAAGFVPLYRAEDPGDVYSTLSLWRSLLLDGPASTSGLGVLLLVVVVLTAVWAHRARTSAAVPLVALLVAVVGGYLVLVDPGYSPRPGLAAGGGLFVGACVLLTGTTLLDVWWLRLRTHPTRTAVPADDASRP